MTTNAQIDPVKLSGGKIFMSADAFPIYDAIIDLSSAITELSSTIRNKK